MVWKDSGTAKVNALTVPLVRYLERKGCIQEDAHDFAQEAFLRLHKFRQSHATTNSRAFLFRTAKNLVIDQRRHARIHEKYVSEQFSRDDKMSPSLERVVVAQQELDAIYKAIEKLPAKVRQAFLLHRIRDLSYPEIAREMNVSTSMVEKYITKALKLIRRELYPQGVMPKS